MLRWKNKPSGVQSTLVLDVDQCLLNSFIAEGDPVNSLELLSVAMQTANVHNRERMMSTSFHQEGQWYDFCAVKRPGLDDFLAQARQLFDNVGVWTAGAPEYAAPIVEEIFRDHYIPDFVLTRDDTIKIPGAPPGADYHKPLSVIEKKLPNVGIDRRFTLFLDDTNRNFLHNPDNGITIPRFEPPNIDPFATGDICLPQLVSWLQSPAVYECADVRKLDKTDIFVTPLRADITKTPHMHRMSFSARTG